MRCPSCGSRATMYDPRFDEWQCKACDLVWPDGVTDLTVTSLRVANDALSVIPEQENLDAGCMISVAQYLIRKAFHEVTGADL